MGMDITAGNTPKKASIIFTPIRMGFQGECESIDLSLLFSFHAIKAKGGRESIPFSALDPI